ncbi:PREDICTED: HTH-type transcriptional activator SoxR homolog [Cyphomyrmex costatus]|uniref:HTH-type transcriptional activator SoxR homolog n=1 Tax=Cyphomyrmex costatus TaxID=456900 RepID=UPI0008523D64|nr:PREDICTED: HTH-type transcriptional activator SoxR homolog [Cyphomyrmex costatus]
MNSPTIRRSSTSRSLRELNHCSEGAAAEHSATTGQEQGAVTEFVPQVISAIRYYENLGLIEAQRTPGSRRVFARNTLRRLAFIRAASNVGLSIDEIGAELALLPAGRNPTKADWARISADWRGRLDEQITALTMLRNGLDSCIGCGCLSLKACRFSNPDDVLQHKGAGARLLPKTLRD